MAQSNYVAFELELEENWQQLIMVDLNGDGAKDIAHSHYQPGIGRELHIYYQSPDGSFDSTPRRIEIKTEIIAVGFADLREEPGKELLLFANSGVFSLSSAIEGYAGNIKQLLQWDLVATIPNLEQVQFIENIIDIDGDGHIDLLLPGDEVFGFFKGDGAENFELISSFSTTNKSIPQSQRGGNRGGIDANISINPEQGLVVNLSRDSTSPYSDFIEQWTEEESETRTLLRSESWMPSAILAQLNDDKLLDVIYLNVGDDGLGQLNIHYQNPQTGFSETADWTGSMETRGDIQLADMNQDQQVDLLRISGNGNDWDARFFKNQNGKFNLEQPDQIMRFSGYDVRLSFPQIEDEGAPVLNVSYYTIPIVDAIRNASINRISLLYGSDASETGQLFNRRPDTRLEDSFSAANVRGLAEQMSLDYDIDGDGVKDALYITANGTLAAKRIDEHLGVADQPFWEYISARTVFEFEVLNLNTDQYPDLLLKHANTTTLLVASP
ncbi:MAG: hypothetical protein COA96_11190 [SAR86 cluster bacterium]|uniref:VCBS repeat-containing protein n=1 Tax=SAR86 cluster bacterium TaxID=2030880 RepID=A0A2A5AWS6_9GAMM|nr:MAG: hypothetical protein COA96_11190 [SAR86 cluster bacterium]